MSDAFVSINGILANSATVHFPFAGRWILDLRLDGAVMLSGLATAKIGVLTLVGTVVPAYSGAWVGGSAVRVVGGAGGWSKRVNARSYHNDGLVKRADVLTALARDAGEQLDTGGDAARLRSDFTRLAGPASRVLEHVLGVVPWRVDFDGVTRYGDRPAAAIGVGAELLEVDVQKKLMTFGTTDPTSVPIGARVDDARLGGPLVFREVVIEVKASSARLLAWGVAA